MKNCLYYLQKKNNCRISLASVIACHQMYDLSKHFLVDWSWLYYTWLIISGKELCVLGCFNITFFKYWLIANHQCIGICARGKNGLIPIPLNCYALLLSKCPGPQKQHIIIVIFFNNSGPRRLLLQQGFLYYTDLVMANDVHTTIIIIVKLLVLSRKLQPAIHISLWWSIVNFNVMSKQHC